MYRKLIGIMILLCLACFLLAGCQNSQDPAPTETPASSVREQDDQGEPFAVNVTDKDFSALKTPGSQESSYEYRTFFLPAIDGISQPYVGDVMPYYEDGVDYI